MPPIAGGFTVGSSDMRGGLWFYASSDAVATVRGAGYFTDGFNRGMRKGDVVFVYDTNTPNMSLNWVSTVSSTGATISQLTT
jgi:hypothetical protein